MVPPNPSPLLEGRPRLYFSPKLLCQPPPGSFLPVHSTCPGPLLIRMPPATTVSLPLGSWSLAEDGDVSGEWPPAFPDTAPGMTTSVFPVAGTCHSVKSLQRQRGASPCRERKPTGVSVIYWERLLLGSGSGQASVSLRLTSPLRPPEGGQLREKTLTEHSVPGRQPRTPERQKPCAQEVPGRAFGNAPDLEAASGRGHHGMGPTWQDPQRLLGGQEPSTWDELGEALPAGEKSFECRACSKVFKPFVCALCGAAFSQGSSLFKHQRVHTGEKPFACPQCGRAFSHSSNLTQHQLLHTGERPFRCGDCGKAFAKGAVLLSHRRIHTGEKPFVCTQCGRAFRERPALFHHQRIHTGEKPVRRSRASLHTQARSVSATSSEGAPGKETEPTPASGPAAVSEPGEV
ncbi:hypothetical protein H8959_006345 [Pygathrix nigripes]